MRSFITFPIRITPGATEIIRATFIILLPVRSSPNNPASVFVVSGTVSSWRRTETLSPAPYPNAASAIAAPRAGDERSFVPVAAMLRGCHALRAWATLRMTSCAEFMARDAALMSATAWRRRISWKTRWVLRPRSSGSRASGRGGQRATGYSSGWASLASPVRARDFVPFRFESRQVLRVHVSGRAFGLP